MLSNAHLATWPSPKSKVATRWSVITVEDSFAIAATKQSMVMIIIGVFFHSLFGFANLVIGHEIILMKLINKLFIEGMGRASYSLKK